MNPVEPHLGPDTPDTPAIQFVGIAPGGAEVLVTVWDDGGIIQRALDAAGVTPAAEVAIRHGHTWGAPARCEQVK